LIESIGWELGGLNGWLNGSLGWAVCGAGSIGGVIVVVGGTTADL